MIKTYEYVEKNLDLAKEKMFYELSVSEKDVFFKDTEETSGLFKSKKTKLTAVLKDDMIDYVKELVLEITSKMGIDANIEAKKRDDHLKFTLFSDKNSILIGRNGQTLDSIQIIVRSSIQNNTGFKVNIIIDVEDYREKQKRNLERNIKRIAFDVKKSGVEVTLDPMNSYERRLVHSICSEIGGITTESVGEEPNRFITIKKK